MISSGGDRTKIRKDKTLRAHRLILEFDEKDINGQVLFHFQKGVGITSHEIKEFSSWKDSTTDDNKVLVFNAHL